MDQAFEAVQAYSEPSRLIHKPEPPAKARPNSKTNKKTKQGSNKTGRRQFF